MAVKKYTSEAINVTFDTKRCIHAARCVQGLPAVFDTDKRPWIQPGEASPDEVAAIIMECPSGALQFERLDGDEAEPIPAENTARLMADGPLYVRGNITVQTSEGAVMLEDTRLALCRCGASQHKPFCDNSHLDADFAHEGTLADNGLGEADTDGALTLTVLPDGPVLIEGPVTVVSAEGKTRFEGSKGAFCRCGASGNKPFCDGSHVTVGFEG